VTRSSMLRLVRRRARRCANQIDLFARSMGLACFRRGWHDAGPTRIGGALCRDCGRAFADLDDAGTLRTTGCYVSTSRRPFTRDGRALTHVREW
jgi:hypothetical protein